MIRNSKRFLIFQRKRRIVGAITNRLQNGASL